MNANAASAMTLRAAASVGDAQLEAIADFLAGADRKPGTGDDRYFASTDELLEVIVEMPAGLTLGVDISVLSIIIQVTEGDSVFELKAVLSLDGSGIPSVQTGTGQAASSSSSSRASRSTASST